MSSFKTEVTKFTLVGIVNSALTFLIFIFLLKVSKVNYRIALTITWLIGIIFSYILNFTWVFKPEQKLEFKRRFGKYVLAYLMSFTFNYFTLSYIVERFKFDPFYVQTALIPLILVFNFTTSKFWSLRPTWSEK